MGRPRPILLALVAATLAAVVVTVPPRPAAAAVEGPEGDAFYVPPDPLPSGAPGELIWYREMAPPDGAPDPAPTRVWKVLYHSRTWDGDDVAVSGTVAVPDRPAPGSGWPIVSWAHATVGLADDCGYPSRHAEWQTAFELGGEFEHALVQTDYQGLGPAGPHPYLVGTALGQNVLDLARAAAQIPGIDLSNRVAIDGFSEGGHAALFAGELAATYAPDLDVVGVLARSPAVELRQLLETSARTPSASGYAIYGAHGFSRAYDDLGMRDVLTASAKQAALRAGRSCVHNFGVWGIPASDYLAANPWSITAWRRKLKQNTPGRQMSAPPVLVLAGLWDPVVPAAAIQKYVTRACNRSPHVQLLLDPLGSHGGYQVPFYVRAERWLKHRMEGRALPAACDA